MIDTSNGVLKCSQRLLDLKWFVTVSEVKKLKLFEYNPRFITEEDFKALETDIKETGFHDVIIIDSDYTILSGNQRKRKLDEMGILEVYTMFPERKLTETERHRVLLSHNIHRGKFNYDMLANFDPSILKKVGSYVPDIDFDNLPEPKWSNTDFPEVVKKCPHCGKEL